MISGFGAIVTKAFTFARFVRVNEVKRDVGPRELEVWSRGGMDAAMIEGALRAVEREPIWDFWRVRDVRTLAAVADFTHADLSADVNFLASMQQHEDAVYGAHHALGDARRQAWHAAELLRGLKGKQLGEQQAMEAAADVPVPVPGVKWVLKAGQKAAVSEWLDQIPEDIKVQKRDGSIVSLRDLAMERARPW